MGFEKIGPYRLTGRDHIAAALVIAFLLGRGRMRLKSWVFAGGGLFIIVGGLVSGSALPFALGVFLILYMFVLAPLLRARHGSKDIYLEYSPDGVVADTPNARTTYKWATIGTVRKVGSRLFIMISDWGALVVSDRVADRQTMADVMATIDQHRPAAAG